MRRSRASAQLGPSSAIFECLEHPLHRFEERLQDSEHHGLPVLLRLLLAVGVMALCVVVHASGVTHALRRLRRVISSEAAGFWWSTWICIRLAVEMIGWHLVEISAWAFLYVWRSAIPDMQSALYFSAVTYTTTGYGDLVLPPEWRLVGGIEALTGILMCGWSTAFLFAVVSRMRGADPMVT